VDPATHFALQVKDLSQVLAMLLSAGQKPYQLSLASLEPNYVNNPQESLSYGIGTLYVNDPDGNVVEFIDINQGYLLGSTSRCTSEGHLLCYQFLYLAVNAT